MFRLFVMLGVLGMAAAGWAEEPRFEFPLIEGYGGVVRLPAAAEHPQQGAKIVFDITAASQAEEVNRGLESVARYLNLNAQAGHAARDVKLALVLHGGATKCALGDAAYSRYVGAQKNPNLSLVAELKRHGVEVLVCGQSLARNQYAASDVAADVTIAASAMTVNVNKQLAGYAYLAVH